MAFLWQGMFIFNLLANRLTPIYCVGALSLHQTYTRTLTQHTYTHIHAHTEKKKKERERQKKRESEREHLKRPVLEISTPFNQRLWLKWKNKQACDMQRLCYAHILKSIFLPVHFSFIISKATGWSSLQKHAWWHMSTIHELTAKRFLMCACWQF